MAMNTHLGLLLVLAATAGRAIAAEAVDPQEILRRADEVRNPSESFQMRVVVRSGDDLSDRSVFEVATQGNQKTLIRTLEPGRDVGRNLLMLNEEMWAYVPNLKRAVRVSLSQKLTGQAANGDISRMRWTGDYEVKVESEDESQWVLFLSAQKKGLTYAKVRVWVEKGTFRPLHAEYLALSGQPLKRAVYEGYRVLAGRQRPGTITIADAIRPADRSVIEIAEMEVKTFPASVFNQNSLSE